MSSAIRKKGHVFVFVPGNSMQPCACGLDPYSGGMDDWLETLPPCPLPNTPPGVGPETLTDETAFRPEFHPSSVQSVHIPPVKDLSANLRNAVADVLDVSVAQLRQGGPEASRALRQVGLVTRAARELLAAVDGVALPRRRHAYTDEDAYDAPDVTEAVPDVEPANSGLGALNSVTQSTENYGNRVINEAMALGRAYVAGQAKPKLSDVLDAYYSARGRGDAEVSESLRAKLAADYDVKVGVGTIAESTPAPSVRTRTPCPQCGDDDQQDPRHYPDGTCYACSYPSEKEPG